MPSNPGPRIFWSEEELAAVFKRVKELREAGRRDTPYLLVAEAQTVLPLHRRRNIINIGAVPSKLRVQVEDLYKLGITVGTAAPIPEPVPAPPPPPLIPPADEDLCAAVFKVLGGRLQVYLRTLLRDALVEAGHELLNDPRLVDFMSPGVRVHPAMPKVTQPVHVDSVRHPKILLVGVKQGQRETIIKQFGDDFRLTWWIDESHQVLNDRARGADRVIATVDAIGHSAIATIKNAGQESKLTRAYGAQTTILTLLDLYLREYKATGKLPPRVPTFGG